MAAFIFLNSAVSLTAGKGLSLGIGTPRNLHRGSQPCLTCRKSVQYLNVHNQSHTLALYTVAVTPTLKTSSCSAGTTRLTSAFHSSYT